ncbi:phage tail protein, partial [Escherichia coli]
METFHWKVRPDMNVVSEPKVVTVKLGDGYEQRRAAGLNNQLSTYSVTIRVRKCEHPSLKAFLERHGGVRAFQWTPPYDWKLMQDIPQETHHETTRLTQSAQVVLWEIDLTEVGGERYFFCNEQNEKGEPVTWQG